MMLHQAKIGSIMFICILSSIQGTHANCANITNLTRISATSVVVEWEYHQSPQLSFDIIVFDLEQSSVIQRLSTIMPERKPNGGLAYLANSDAANAPQLVCFTVNMATSDPLNMTTTSSGLSADDMCPKKCLPSTPGQIPAAPEGFMATNTSTTFSEVEFSWNLIDSSVVLACYNRASTSVPTIIKEVCGSSSPVTVGGFAMPSNRYTCSLSQKSGAIVGNSTVIDFTTDVERQSSPDFNITATAVSAQVTVSGLLGYFYWFTIITLQTNGEEISTPSRSISDQLRTDPETIQIENLHPFTAYKIELQVQRSQTDPWSYPASREIKTPEEAPAQIRRASVLVHTVSIMPPVILVAWEPPEINNGSIIAYEYCWRGDRLECANTTGNSTTINLPTNSNANSVYTVKVAAVSAGGSGPYSDNIYVYIPTAEAPNIGYTPNLYDMNRTNFIQLKFKGINNCSLWRAEQSDSLKSDITFDLLTQLSNLCNCNLIDRHIDPLSLQCSNHYTDEILLVAQLLNTPSREELALLTQLEQWSRGPSPNVTVSNLGIQLRLDRSCPLYTTSSTSSECLQGPTQSGIPEVVTGSSNGGAIAGALIGGILLGMILTVGVGAVILLLLWWRQLRGGRDKKAQMMKKVDPNVGTTLTSKRYVPSTENLHQESNEAGYEPISAYIKEGSGVGNTYEPQQADKQGAAKQKKQKNSSNKDSDKKVMEDESGYVVPDTLWEGKRRPVAPGSAVSAQTSTATGKASKNTTSVSDTTKKVASEYDVPEGIEHQDTSKVKGQQRESQSAHWQQTPTSTMGQKEHMQYTSSGKDHQKQKLQAKEPSKITIQPTEQSTQNNELKKTAAAAVQGDKPTKKNKPKLHQKKENSSKLALQYQSNTSTSPSDKSTGSAATNTAAPQQDHTAVKSKLQNLFAPASSSQPTKATTHAKLSKKPNAASAMEGAKIQHQQQQEAPQKTSKVMAMAQKLQGAVGSGQASAKAGPGEKTDSKSPGAAKKQPLLPLQKNIGSSTAASASHQQGSGAPDTKPASSHHLPPAKKEKPLGKGTANIAMKSNTAYDQWSREKDGIADTPMQNPSGTGPTRSYAGGGRSGNQNAYRY